MKGLNVFVVGLTLLSSGWVHGQVNKRTGWMPWQLEAMKDVEACDKLRGAAEQAMIRRSPRSGNRPGLNSWNRASGGNAEN